MPEAASAGEGGCPKCKMLMQLPSKERMKALGEAERRSKETEDGFKKLEGGDRVAQHVKCHTKAGVGETDAALGWTGNGAASVSSTSPSCSGQ